MVDLSNFEVREHKIRYLTFSKQAIADLAAFIIIFALFATFLYLSTQYSNEIEHCTLEIDPPPENPYVQLNSYLISLFSCVNNLKFLNLDQ